MPELELTLEQIAAACKVSPETFIGIFNEGAKASRTSTLLVLEKQAEEAAGRVRGRLEQARAALADPAVPVPTWPELVSVFGGE